MSGSGRVSVSVSGVHTIQGHTFELVAKALIVSKTFTDFTVICVPKNPHDFDSYLMSYDHEEDSSSESGSSHLPSS